MGQLVSSIYPEYHKSSIGVVNYISIISELKSEFLDI